MVFSTAVYTDAGTERITNQDSLCLRRAKGSGRDEILMAVVCDGMGGLNRGELASATAVRHFGAWFDSNLEALSIPCSKDFSTLRKQWTDLLQQIHQELLLSSKADGNRMGTTVSAFFACGRRYLTLTIGDSRIYEHSNQWTQLTEDQSLVARELAFGRITEEESRRHPQRNILLQCLGTGEPAIPAFTEGTLKPNASYLLCTDGLVHELAPEEFSQRLQHDKLNTTEDMTRVLAELADLCKQRGERDNITAVLIKTAKDPTAIAFSGIQNLFSGNRENRLPPTLLETLQIIHTDEEINR